MGLKSAIIQKTSRLLFIIPLFFSACSNEHILLSSPLTPPVKSLSNAQTIRTAEPIVLKTTRLRKEEYKKLTLISQPVTYRNVPILLKLKGHIEPDFGHEVDVSPRILGRVVKILVHPGETVKPGQIMAILDSHEISSMEAELIEAKSKLAIAAAQRNRESQVYKEQFLRPKSLIEAKARFAEGKAQLELADSEFRRQQSLYEEKIASQRDFTAAKIARDEARTDYDVAKINLQREEHLYSNQGLMKKDLQLAEAEYERALRHLDTLRQRLLFLGMSPENIKTVLDNNQISGTLQIIAPVSGSVTHADIALGEMVHTTQTMFRIIDLSRMIVKADLPEIDISLVQLGSPVQVVLPGYPNRVFQGTINYISETINKENNTVPIRAKLDNPERLLKANMSAQIILEGEEKTILSFPKEACITRNNNKYVFVKNGEGIELRQINTGAEGRDYIEVLDGLHENEQVVTNQINELIALMS